MFFKEQNTITILLRYNQDENFSTNKDWIVKQQAIKILQNFAAINASS